jgi:WD40 repeat protein
MVRLPAPFLQTEQWACAKAVVGLLFLGVLAFAPNSSHASPVILTGHADYVLYVKYLPDGVTLLSGSPDRTIRLWDTKGGHPPSVWQTVPDSTQLRVPASSN